MLSALRYRRWAEGHEYLDLPDARALFGKNTLRLRAYAGLLGVSVETLWAVEGSRQAGAEHPLTKLLGYDPQHPTLWRKRLDKDLYAYTLVSHPSSLDSASLHAISTPLSFHGRGLTVGLSSEASWHEPGRTVLLAMELVRPAKFDASPVMLCGGGA